jgi:peptide/nickel transport system substrate-binding protein
MSAATRTPRATRRSIVATLAILLVAVGCRSSQDVPGPDQSADAAPHDAGPPQDGGSLVVGVYQETSGWNPTYDRWAQMGALVGSSVLEPLAVLDGAGRAQPWLATGWEHDATFTSWTVHLREGVTFHDGTVFDATAVKVNIEDAKTAVLSSFALSSMLGPTTVLDAHTVRIDLQKPWSAFPIAYLASQGAMMRSPSSLVAGTASAHPVGTGPFVFKDWTRDDHLDADRNPAYWRPGEPHLDRIEFRVVTDDSARLSALRSNDLDMMFTVSAADAADLAGSFTVVRDWDTEQSMLVANTRPKVGDHVNPMADIHGRRAIALATDRQAIADLVGQGLHLYDGPFSPESPWGQPDAQSGYVGHDVDAARREVQQYLADSGQPTMDVQLLGAADTTTTQILQALQAQWRAVGITSSVKTADAMSFNQGLIGSLYDLALTAPYSAPDPDQDFYFWSRENIGEYGRLSINFSGYASDDTESLMLRSRMTDDPATRHDLVDQLVQELNRNVTSIWLYATPFSLIAARHVHGLDAAADVPFANYQPKDWWGQVWLAH